MSAVSDAPDVRVGSILDGEQSLSVRAEEEFCRPIVVAGEDGDGSAGRNLPDPDRVVA
jgi:hypothetical protein